MGQHGGEVGGLQPHRQRHAHPQAQMAVQDRTQQAGELHLQFGAAIHHHPVGHGGTDLVRDQANRLEKLWLIPGQHDLPGVFLHRRCDQLTQQQKTRQPLGQHGQDQFHIPAAELAIIMDVLHTEVRMPQGQPGHEDDRQREVREKASHQGHQQHPSPRHHTPASTGIRPGGVRF